MQVMALRDDSPNRPAPWLRRLLRIPVFAYRARLGWLFGGRLVLIEHIGRRSGRLHRTVLEVVEHDRRSGAITVASGHGTGADWYRNLLAHPHAHMVVRRRRVPVHVRPVPEETGAHILTGYARRHPRAARHVVRMLGVDGADYAAIGRRIPFLRLLPTRENA
jgi:deazaflavin-dependent oxidoreductase (nitroreductase family)